MVASRTPGGALVMKNDDVNVLLLVLMLIRTERFLVSDEGGSSSGCRKSRPEFLARL